VVADSLERARHAASLVDVDYETAPAVLALDNPEAQRNAVAADTFVGREKLQITRGDADAALADAEAKVDVTYATPIENHNPIETYSTIAMWETPGRLTVYEATRGMKQLQKVLWNTLRLQQDNVRIISPFVGGA